MESKSIQATLVLEDGTIMTGKSFGAKGEAFGELVFNTSMFGYQEIITDPANQGKVLVFTYPEIGNIGINNEDFEGEKPSVQGIVVKDYPIQESHYKSKLTLSKYLEKNGVIAIQGVDTRSLTKKIRDKGAIKCLITTNEVSDISEKTEKIRAYKASFKDSTAQGKMITKGGGDFKIGVIDYGVKKSTLETFVKSGCDIITFHPDTQASDIAAKKCDALVLSNGYRSPEECNVKAVRELLGQVPILGIGLGAQALSLALDIKIHKLKYGHRGSNQPVINLETQKVMITSQNHSHSTDEASLPPEITPLYKNLNDDTLEGFECKKKKVLGIEFCPNEDIIRGWLGETRQP